LYKNGGIFSIKKQGKKQEAKAALEKMYKKYMKNL